MMTSMPFKGVQGLAMALALTACAAAPIQAQEKSAAAPVAASATVRIDNFSFTPAEIAIAPGTALTWVNGDDIPHTVVASNKAFRSKVLDTEQQFTFTFSSPGSFEYFCSLHPHMKGKVIVK